MEENKKRANFVRLANARVNKTIHLFHLLANLSNKSFYKYSKQDIDKIFNTLEKSLKEAKNECLGHKGQKETFKL